MQVHANRPLLEKDPSAKALIDELQSRSDEFGLQDAILYHNFPLYRDSEELVSRAHVLIASPAHGVLILESSAEVRDANDKDAIESLGDQLDQVTSHIVARLIKSPRLRSGPQSLQVKIHEALFLPSLVSRQPVAFAGEAHISILSSVSELGDFMLARQLEHPCHDQFFSELLAALEGSAGLVKPRDRSLDPDKGNTRGKALARLELAIANFDGDQKRAALNIINGPQRVRGLAGSGKTIILTWKAALLHLQNPEALVVYTFYTKSLYELIRALITRFYRHNAERDPDWRRIQVLHAWGGRSLPGVYSALCRSSGVEPIPFGEARSKSLEPFDYVCDALLNHGLHPTFDYTIIDEGQDFPASFYRLCHAATRNGRVIWGYDECQNILDIDLQDPRSTFGSDEQGNPLVDLDSGPPGEQRDIVLHRCYRNPRHILTYAFALGLGLYNRRILQMPEDNGHWTDLGFVVRQGNSEAGDPMVVERPRENTPLVTNELFDEEEEISVQVFDDYQRESEFVVDRILHDLDSELLPEDILVISLDDRFARRYFSLIEEGLENHRVRTFNLLDAPANVLRFYRKNHITLSTVYRAKGNEAGSVYVIGADATFVERNSIRERNKLFTAMTRAKGWLSISGVGIAAADLKEEYERVKQDYPRLCFTMPDRSALKTFQRDLSSKQAQLNLFQRQLEGHAKKMGLEPEELIKMLSQSASRKKNGQ